MAGSRSTAKSISFPQSGRQAHAAWRRTDRLRQELWTLLHADARSATLAIHSPVGTQRLSRRRDGHLPLLLGAPGDPSHRAVGRSAMRHHHQSLPSLLLQSGRQPRHPRPHPRNARRPFHTGRCRSDPGRPGGELGRHAVGLPASEAMGMRGRTASASRTTTISCFGAIGASLTPRRGSTLLMRQPWPRKSRASKWSCGPPSRLPAL